MKGRKVPEETWTKILEDLSRGEYVKDVAAFHEVSDAYVYRRLKAEGLPFPRYVRPPTFTPEELARLYRAWNEDLPKTVLARRFKVTTVTIWKYIKRAREAGVPLIEHRSGPR